MVDPTSHFIGKKTKTSRGEGPCKAVAGLELQARWPPPRCQASAPTLPFSHPPLHSLAHCTFVAGSTSNSRPFHVHLLWSWRGARTPPSGSRRDGLAGVALIFSTVFSQHPSARLQATYSYLSTKATLLLSNCFVFTH